MSRERIKEIARRVLAGDIGIVEGSREICQARAGLPFAQLQAEVLLPFIAFDSELHDFPIGESRKYWDEKSLAEKDIQLEQLVENSVELLKAWG
jgi:hypothetical protein